MKQIRLLSFIILGLFSSVLWGGTLSSRKTTLINSDWKYFKGDCPGAEQRQFDDTSWEHIGLPHSFSIPYFLSRDFYVGYGWYRKFLKLNSDDLKGKLFLEFDGVFQETEVFVNGKKVGNHIGGYTGFSIDITSAVQIGDNLLAVRVNNIWKPDVAPRAGEHVFSGGIYRNVRLVKTGNTHIAWYGTFVTTPEIEQENGKNGKVKIETEICNDSNHSIEYTLQTRIVNAEGKEMTRVESKELLAARSRQILKQQTKPIQKPVLWTPQSPYLYKAISLLYKDGKLIDHTEPPFGFRWFEWTADKGFFLNGERLVIRGANVHQDQAGWGDAVTESAMYRDVKMIKEAGFNFIRGSHYPHSPAFSRACDEKRGTQAADGNLNTYWRANAADTAPYWLLDTEKRLRIHEIQLHFPEQARYSYVVEVSTDRENWRPICDRLQNEKEEVKTTLPLNDSRIFGRFIRIRFADSQRAALSEVIVKGIVLR